ncbi:MAG: peptidoglycan DD-metalloendopeptidase family protein, partial [Desulfovibrionaceae bacterium]|nr:peptidoglycan DD-metalloendopeptidase family protein [Desulfovibrionaceae bacterium]
AFFTVATYRVGLEVILDDQSIGYVATQEVVSGSMAFVAESASQILGYPYTPSNNIQYQFSVVSRNKIFDRQETVESLLMQIPEIGRLHTLRIDGEVVGASESRAAIENLLEEILASYSGPGVEPYILNDVSVEHGLASRTLLRSEDEFRDILASNHSEEVHYTVRWEESADLIADAFGLSVETLREFNPDADLAQLHMGQTLLVKKRKPFLSVSYDKTGSYIKSIPHTTQYLEDDSLWLGETRVQAEGASGEARLYTRQGFLDGYAQPVEITHQEILSQPVEKVIVSGTKIRAATGTFIRPTNGRFSSGYGYRTLYGRRQFHQGVDYASPTGTPIHASDGGVVTQAGWMSGYGLVVVVDHGNGFSTAYGHCSKINVSAGQTVGQGERIALVGNTGRSTGSHVHFEIRVNGAPQNPLRYMR